MNDGSPRCSHGALAVLIARPDLGEGWVQPIAEDCGFCQRDPSSAKIPYKPGPAPEAPKPSSSA